MFIHSFLPSLFKSKSKYSLNQICSKNFHFRNFKNKLSASFPTKVTIPYTMSVLILTFFTLILCLSPTKISASVHALVMKELNLILPVIYFNSFPIQPFNRHQVPQIQWTLPEFMAFTMRYFPALHLSKSGTVHSRLNALTFNIRRYIATGTVLMQYEYSATNLQAVGGWEGVREDEDEDEDEGEGEGEEEKVERGKEKGWRGNTGEQLMGVEEMLQQKHLHQLRTCRPIHEFRVYVSMWLLKIAYANDILERTFWTDERELIKSGHYWLFISMFVLNILIGLFLSLSWIQQQFFAAKIARLKDND